MPTVREKSRSNRPEKLSEAMTDAGLEAAARNAARLIPDEKTQSRLDQRAADALRVLRQRPASKSGKTGSDGSE